MRCRRSTSPTATTARPPPSRVAQARGGSTGSHGYFLSVIFPHHQMTILDYNRVVRDLNGRSADALLAALRERFTVAASDRPVRPATAGEFGMFLAGRWYRLTFDPKLVPQNDPIGRLPVTLLASNVLEPLFGIVDQRTDKRIDFVGGGRGLDGTRKAGGFGRNGRSLRAVSDADDGSDGGCRRRTDHAAEIDLVRAQACRRHGQSRAGLT